MSYNQFQRKTQQPASGKGQNTRLKGSGAINKHHSSFQQRTANGNPQGFSYTVTGNPQTKNVNVQNHRESSKSTTGNNHQTKGRPNATSVHYAPSSKDRAHQQNVSNNFQSENTRTQSPSVQTSPQYQALANATKEIEKLKKENAKLKAEIDNLTSRLSSFASKQLSAGNPNITDLSDINRPSKIGENFTQIYDDEWTEAFEALKTVVKSEEEIVKILSSLIQNCYEFAVSESNLQQNHMVSMMHSCMLKQDHQLDKAFALDKNLQSICQRYAKDLRKGAALSSVPGLKKIFNATILKQKELYKKLASTTAGKTYVKSLEDYCDALVQQAWLMRVQDPPMVMCFSKEGEVFNRDEFKEYGKKGKTTKLCVWPSVRLHADGHLVSKGHVLPV